MSEEAGAGAGGEGTPVANATDGSIEKDVGADGQPLPDSIGKEPGDGEGKKGDFDWKSHLPDDMKADAVFKDVHTLESLAKQFKDGQSFIGDSIRLPNEKSTAEDVDKFFTKLGRPATANEYDYELPEIEGTEWDKDVLADLDKVFHTAGLNNAQVETVLEGYAAINNDAAQKQGQDIGKALTELKAEWGPLYERNVHLSLRAVEHLGGEEAKDLFNDTGIGNHPTMIKMFQKIGSQLAEDNIITGEVQGSVNKDEAKGKIAAINGDKTHAYWDVNNPGHNHAKEEMRKLFQLAYD